MLKPVVALAESPTLPVDHQPLQNILGDSCTLQSVDLPFHAENRPLHESARQILHQSAAIIVRAGNLDRALIQGLDNTRIIALHGAGVDQVDLAAATNKGIWVTNAPGCNSQAVAELTIGLMLDCLRKISTAAVKVHRGEWESARSLGGEISGKTVGLIGWGNCAQKVGTICHAMGASILVTRQSHHPTGQEWAPLISLEELLGRADIISLHIPLSSQTQDFINQKQIERLKPGAILINTSRGGVLNQDALLWGLDQGIIGAAGLDVLPEEPPSAATREVLRRDHVVVTPHIGGSTAESLRRIAATVAEDIKLVLAGEQPRHAVNQIQPGTALKN